MHTLYELNIVDDLIYHSDNNNTLPKLKECLLKLLKIKRHFIQYHFCLYCCFSFFTYVNAQEGEGLLDSITDLLKKEPKKEITLDSSISLTPDGDVNKNNEIDGGDIVRFTFILSNTTDKRFLYSTLYTGVDKKQLNFIHNIYGTTGLDEEEGVIILSNIRMESESVKTISFDARVNYSNEEQVLIVEPQLIDTDKKPLARSVKKEVTAKRNMPDNLPGVITKKEESQ